MVEITTAADAAADAAARGRYSWADGFRVAWTTCDGYGGSDQRHADPVAAAREAERAGRGSYVVAAWGPRRSFVVWTYRDGWQDDPREIG